MQYIAIRTDITKQKAFEQQQQSRLKIAAIKLEITNTFNTANILEKQLSEGLLLLFKLPKFNLKPKACIYIFNDDRQTPELVVKQGDFCSEIQADQDRLHTIFEQNLQRCAITVTSLCSEDVCKKEPSHGHYIVPLFSDHDGSELQQNNLVGGILLFTEVNSILDDEKIQLLSESATIFSNAIFRDKAAKLLKNATETALQNSKLKGEFLASMSHEIRTPMNGVLGMLGLLLNSKLNADQKHKATLAQSSAQSLLVLINDILDFSKVEAGKMQLDIIDFNLREMLGELLESMAFCAQEKGVEIILDVTNVEYSMVKGDPGRIRQVTTNLISNAIKFTDHGEIKISVEIKEQSPGKLFLQCHVSDSGIGIPADKVSALFDTFTQVDTSTTRKYGGTGLGLAICKKLSQLMGGDVHVTSQLGKGSTFTFTAILETSQQSQRVLPSVDISKLDLLIVDDNATNLEVLRGQLEHWGATVTEANHGQKAIEICTQRLSSGQKIFDVALLDMQMPGMDGAELGKILSKDDKFSDMKLVIMTSISTQNESHFFADFGFDAYFPKPATTSDLFRALSVVVDDGEVLNSASPLVTRDYLQSLIHHDIRGDILTDTCPNSDKLAVKILLVEDNKINQMVALGILDTLGCTADIAENGKQAISILINSAHQRPYQLIYMDCQMPVMDGYQTTQNIRKGDAGDQYKNIPIIAMTANAMQGDREKCLQSGMNDYIGKPLDPKFIEAKLYQWLSKGTVPVTSDKKVKTENVKKDKVKIQELACWDQDSALERLMNKETLLISLINTFIEEMPAKVEQLTYAIMDENKKEIALLAHTMKGASANLSALKLAQHCFELEKMANSQQSSRADYQCLSEPLQGYYTEIIAEFNHYLSNIQLPRSAQVTISIDDAIVFLTLLSKRLAESDYIESEELIVLIDSQFSEPIDELLNELQQMLTLFDLNSAQQLSEKIITQLKYINEGSN